MRNRVISVIAAMALALAAAVAPAALASAVIPTISVTVQLTQPGGALLTAVDEDADIQLSSTTPGGFSEYAAAAPIPDSSSDYAGTITAGLVTFAGVPASDQYQLTASAGEDYTSKTIAIAASTSNLAESVTLRKLATITGTLTGPGGTPLEGAQVLAIHNDIVFSAATDAEGDYFIHGLHSGTFKIQFNAHWQAGPAIETYAANTADTWSWNGGATSYGKAQWLSVVDQSSTGKSPKDKTGVNGTVAATHTATFTINVAAALDSPFGFRVRVERASFWDSRLAAGSGSSVTIAMNAGNYRVAVETLDAGGGTDQVFFYAGNGKATVSNKHARTLTFTGTLDKTYAIGVAAI